jgi:hypothetical protein
MTAHQHQAPAEVELGCRYAKVNHSKRLTDRVKIDGQTGQGQTFGQHDADWCMLPAIRASKRQILVFKLPGVCRCTCQ